MLILTIVVTKVSHCPAAITPRPLYLSIHSDILAGLIHKSRPIFSTQFHPEAKGGPQDSAYLFDIYLDSVQKYKANQAVFQPQRDSRPTPLLADLLGKERVGVETTWGQQQNARTETKPLQAATAA